jgi:acetyl/propionyl-CoA carboxylase alpha subunit
MLSKLICYAEDREHCIDRMRRALRDYVILGTKTNLSWLRRVISHDAFRAGDVSTRFIADHEAELAPRIPEIVPAIAAAIASAPKKQTGVSSSSPAAASVWDQLGAWGR